MNTIDMVPSRLLNAARIVYELNDRPYHNWWHILSFGHELDAWSEATGVAIQLETALAMVGHDIICDARQKSENEARSANLFVKMLEENKFEPATGARVRELIMLTDGQHEPDPNDLSALAFCDAEYSILGQTPEDYHAYALAIREEWKHVPDEAYAAGRAAFLRLTLNKHPIYRTDFFRNLYEGQARKNMDEELKRLEKGRMA
jgi:predicted metal-dependent HD superfamily phosphohydrolase